jgi:hypothetical protein
MKRVSFLSPTLDLLCCNAGLVSDYPLGYPSWASYQNSDPTFRVYRRFGTLRNRLLLYRQQELAKLEIQLKELDENDARDHNLRIRSRRKDEEDADSKRMQLMDSIDAKLKTYGNRTSTHILQIGTNGVR